MILMPSDRKMAKMATELGHLDYTRAATMAQNTGNVCVNVYTCVRLRVRVQLVARASGKVQPSVFV